MNTEPRFLRDTDIGRDGGEPETAQEAFDQIKDIPFSASLENYARDCFLKGAKWQKEQSKRDAIDFIEWAISNHTFACFRFLPQSKVVYCWDDNKTTEELYELYQKSKT